GAPHAPQGSDRDVHRARADPLPLPEKRSRAGARGAGRGADPHAHHGESLRADRGRREAARRRGPRARRALSRAAQRPDRNFRPGKRGSGASRTTGMIPAQRRGTYGSARRASRHATISRATASGRAKSAFFACAAVIGVSTGPSLSVVTDTPAG